MVFAWRGGFHPLPLPASHSASQPPNLIIPALPRATENVRWLVVNNSALSSLPFPFLQSRRGFILCLATAASRRARAPPSASTAPPPDTRRPPSTGRDRCVREECARLREITSAGSRNLVSWVQYCNDKGMDNQSLSSFLAVRLTSKP